MNHESVTILKILLIILDLTNQNVLDQNKMNVLNSLINNQSIRPVNFPNASIRSGKLN